MSQGLPEWFSRRDSSHYRRWRSWKLRHYPQSAQELTVDVADLAAPSSAERQRILSLLARANMARIRCPEPAQVTRQALLGLGARLGMRRLDANLCADEDAISALQVRERGPASDYIPYTNRPLSWHTDGYYNAPHEQIRAWMLFCVRPAWEGGENTLLDHEIAYIHLRDQSPAFVESLMDPQAMTIPANTRDGVQLRPGRTGPVFSVIDGQLHMRFSARSRNIEWKPSPALQEALACLHDLCSGESAYIYRVRLGPGEGILSNNVLHNRTGFRDHEDDKRKRLLYRARFYDRPRPSQSWGGDDTDKERQGNATCPPTRPV